MHSPGLKQSSLYTAKSFYTLSGASMGVWLFSVVCGQLIPGLRWARFLALLMALTISFTDAKRQNAMARHELLVAFFNALLIYISATGINAVSTGTDFGHANLSRSQAASFLPFLREKALWPPVELIRQKDALEKEGAALQPKPKTELRTERQIDEAKILSSTTGRQHDVIASALELYKQKVPYKWGGKNPQEGFDSSGYVAYVLAKAGVIQDPTTYWSGKLRATLQRTSQEQPGDIIFYNSGACMIYLGDGTSIGMLPGGIATGNLDKSDQGYDRLGVGRY